MADGSELGRAHAAVAAGALVATRTRPSRSRPPTSGLDAGDLVAWSSAAILSGRDDEGCDLLANAYDLFVARPRRRARRPVRSCAPCLNLSNRGRDAARRRLDGARRPARAGPRELGPVVRGYLAVPMGARRSLEGGDVVGARARLRARVEESATQVGDRRPRRARADEPGRTPRLGVGEVAEGLDELDDVMLGVTSGRLSPVVAGSRLLRRSSGSAARRSTSGERASGRSRSTPGASVSPSSCRSVAPVACTVRRCSSRPTPGTGALVEADLAVDALSTPPQARPGCSVVPEGRGPSASAASSTAAQDAFRRGPRGRRRPRARPRAHLVRGSVASQEAPGRCSAARLRAAGPLRPCCSPRSSRSALAAGDAGDRPASRGAARGPRGRRRPASLCLEAMAAAADGTVLLAEARPARGTRAACAARSTCWAGLDGAVRGRSRPRARSPRPRRSLGDAVDCRARDRTPHARSFERLGAAADLAALDRAAADAVARPAEPARGRGAPARRDRPDQPRHRDGAARSPRSTVARHLSQHLRQARRAVASRGHRLGVRARRRLSVAEWAERPTPRHGRMRRTPDVGRVRPLLASIASTTTRRQDHGRARRSSSEPGRPGWRRRSTSRARGIPCLVLDEHERVGDVWRDAVRLAAPLHARSARRAARPRPFPAPGRGVPDGAGRWATTSSDTRPRCTCRSGAACDVRPRRAATATASGWRRPTAGTSSLRTVVVAAGGHRDPWTPDARGETIDPCDRPAALDRVPQPAQLPDRTASSWSARRTPAPTSRSSSRRPATTCVLAGRVHGELPVRARRAGDASAAPPPALRRPARADRAHADRPQAATRGPRRRRTAAARQARRTLTAAGVRHTAARVVDGPRRTSRASTTASVARRRARSCGPPGFRDDFGWVEPAPLGRRRLPRDRPRRRPVRARAVLHGPAVPVRVLVGDGARRRPRRGTRRAPHRRASRARDRAPALA